MLSEKMQDALNGQLNKEMYSAYLYLAMSTYSTYIGLKGFANRFMVQYQEEMIQIEEESNDKDIIARLKLIGKDGNGLLMLDKELAARVFTPPATAEGI